MINKVVYAGQQLTDKSGRKVNAHPNQILQMHGPIIRVTITHPKKIADELTKRGDPVPGVDCNALIDTGAFLSVISPSIATKLNLLQTGFAPIASVNNIEDRPVYYGAMHFSWGRGKEVRMACCEIKGVDCLIGRDVLRHWHLTYDGVNGELTICD